MIVTRPDLTKRKALSKSQLVSADLCQTKAWLEIHDWRPFIPIERVTFGSAVDAGVEQIIRAVSREEDAGSRAMQAAMEVAHRDKMMLPWDEVSAALEGFRAEVLPQFYWPGTVTQPVVRADIPGLGPCEGHPDIILGDGSVLDVKTAARSKEVAGSIELGFYVLLCEAAGMTVPRVGYLAWIRLKKPYWQVAIAPATDELRRYAMVRALAFARARDLDAHVNEGDAEPTNFTLTGGPKGGGLCATCAYSPVNSGPCEIASREAEAA